MPAQRKDVIAKYLARHAEPEAIVASRLDRQTEHVLVVPAHDESPTLLKGLMPAIQTVAARGERVLCIVVVNATDAHSTGVHERNAALLHALARQTAAAALHTDSETPCWYAEADDFDLLVVDRNSETHRLPSRQGVGLARKIGCDLGLAAIHAGSSLGSLIHMSDGDVQLPEDYFDVRATPATAAVIYPFAHQPCGDPSIDEAHARYEAYLRYYVLGLKYAGSAYAFHTIGSCIASAPEAYANVRGVPKRQAGEDFYLLNKLAKIGHIDRAPGAPIAIRARESLRVPFGTGRATHDIAQDVESYRIYDPRVFGLLGAWQSSLSALGAAPAAQAYKTVYEHAGAALSPEDEQRLDTALHTIGAPKALQETAAHSPSPVIRAKRLHDWFDAFRTLKLLHALRDQGLHDVPWRQAIETAPFCQTPKGEVHEGQVDDRGTFETCRRLAELENSPLRA